MLTLDVFLKRLRKTPRTWELIGSSLRMDIAHPRSRTWAACPITSLAQGGAVGSHEWREVARQIGLPLQLAMKIMNAADLITYPPGSSKLRQQLLDACGLKSEPC